MKKSKNYFEELQLCYDRYFDLLVNGGSDPAYTDGVNINLVRNHFCYYINQIKETHPEKKWSCFDWVLSNVLPAVPRGYMARKDEIKYAAQKALDVFNSDKNLKYIQENINLLSTPDKNTICADNVLGYYRRLLMAIEEDDFVAMRRYENPEYYLESFQKCAVLMRKIDLGLFGS